MTEPKHRKLTYAEAHAAHSILARHCRKVGETAVYEDGWDDERVARVVQADAGIHHCRPGHIAGLRKQMYGNLQPPTTAGMAALVRRIENLEARVEHLYNRLSSLLD